MPSSRVQIAALALLVLAACAQRGYGITYPRELRAAHTQSQLDAGVDCLIARIEEQGLLTPGAAAKLITRSAIVVRIYPEPIPISEGVLRSGLYYPDGNMDLAWAPGSSFAESSFQHELVHALLCKAQPLGPDCWADAAHDAHAWWAPVVGPARACWRTALEPRAEN